MHNSPLTVLPPLNRMELGLLRDQHQRPRSDRAPRRHRLLPHLAAPVPEGERRLLRLLQQPGQGRRRRQLRSALFQDFADRYFPGRADRRASTRRPPRQHAALLSGSLGEFARLAVELPGRHRLASARPRSGSTRRASWCVPLPGPERQAAPLDRDRPVRLARPGRPRPPGRQGRRRQAGALQLRPALAVHGVRPRALVRRTAPG